MQDFLLCTHAVSDTRLSFALNLIIDRTNAVCILLFGMCLRCLHVSRLHGLFEAACSRAGTESKYILELHSVALNTFAVLLLTDGTPVKVLLCLTASIDGALQHVCTKHRAAQILHLQSSHYTALCIAATPHIPSHQVCHCSRRSAGHSAWQQGTTAALTTAVMLSDPLSISANAASASSLDRCCWPLRS